MITIIKEGNRIICSMGTYKSMYERLGYEILQENKKTKVKEPKDIKPEGVQDEVKEDTIMPKEDTKVKSGKGRTKKGE